MGLALWFKDLIHEVFIFVKILFNFKRKISARIKTNFS